MLHICNLILRFNYRYPARRATLKSADPCLHCAMSIHCQNKTPQLFGNYLLFCSQTTCYSLKSIELADKKYRSRQSSHKIHWNVESPKIPGQVPIAAHGSFRPDGERVS